MEQHAHMEASLGKAEIHLLMMDAQVNDKVKPAATEICAIRESTTITVCPCLHFQSDCDAYQSQLNIIAGFFQIQRIYITSKMSKTRIITVTPLQLCENPEKYVPEQATVNNIMRTFGRLKRMTMMANSAGTGKLYEVCRLACSIARPHPYSVFSSIFWFNVRSRVTAAGR